MKKLIIFITVLCLILSLCACKNDKKSDEEKKKTDDTEQTESDNKENKDNDSQEGGNLQIEEGDGEGSAIDIDWNDFVTVED